MARVVDLHDTPGVLAGADLAATNLNDILGTDNSEGHKTSELSVLLDGILIVLLDVVREVVHGDTVVLNILHDELLRLGEFGRGEGVGAANDRDDVDAGSETLHQLDIEFAEASIEALVL